MVNTLADGDRVEIRGFGRFKVKHPCETPILRELFKDPKPTHREILEKEVVDEIIFRTENRRNRLMLELMAHGGMRVGEVLKITPSHIEDRKVIIRDPKSGKEAEVVFIPQKSADGLKEYIRYKGIKASERIVPITYPAARAVVKKAGRLVGINLKPHDLTRHAATYASRSSTPIEKGKTSLQGDLIILKPLPMISMEGIPSHLFS
jgi:integrase/recombinase XerD